MNYLAWPYGIYDDYLEAEAQKAGYVAAFSIDRRNAAKDEKMMAQPRYLMQNGDPPWLYRRRQRPGPGKEREKIRSCFLGGDYEA